MLFSEIQRDTDLEILRESIHSAFLDYDTFLEFAEASSIDSAELDPIDNYTALNSLRSFLKEQLDKCPDKEELLGLAASQIGIAAPVVYMDYPGILKNSEIFLVNPSIQPVPQRTPTFVLKLVKCPNSPVAYNLGIFNRELIVASNNAHLIELFPTEIVETLDPDLDFVVNLQRIIWASRGILPGDPETIPMNFLNISKVIEGNKKIQKKFQCVVQNKEIGKIAASFTRVSNTSLVKDGASILVSNLLNLLANNMEEEWIKIPPVNLFKKDAIKACAVY